MDSGDGDIIGLLGQKATLSELVKPNKVKLHSMNLPSGKKGFLNLKNNFQTQKKINLTPCQNMGCLNLKRCLEPQKEIESRYLYLLQRHLGDSFPLGKVECGERPDFTIGNLGIEVTTLTDSKRAARIDGRHNLFSEAKSMIEDSVDPALCAYVDLSIELKSSDLRGGKKQAFARKIKECALNLIGEMSSFGVPYKYSQPPGEIGILTGAKFRHTHFECNIQNIGGERVQEGWFLQRELESLIAKKEDKAYKETNPEISECWLLAAIPFSNSSCLMKQQPRVGKTAFERIFIVNDTSASGAAAYWGLPEQVFEVRQLNQATQA